MALRHRDLVLPDLVFSVVLGLAVLLAFLFLRRWLAEARDAAGFAFGLALLTFIVIGLWFGLQNHGFWEWFPQVRVPPLYAIAAAAGAIGTFVGGYAACRWTHRQPDGLARAVNITLRVAVVAFPVAAVLAGGLQGVPTPGFGSGRSGHIVETIFLAFVLGALAFALPCLLVTFLWCLLYFRMKTQTTLVLNNKLTDRREVCAYVLPHLALAIGWAWNITPLVFADLRSTGFRDPLWPGFALSITLGLAVLLAFLCLRQVFAGGSHWAERPAA